MWWVLAAVAVVLAALFGWLLWRRARGNAWARDLLAASEEATWFARVLLPGLGQSASVDQMTGGWRVASSRVMALEDRLTQLESTAPNDGDAIRARTLRDAVRASRVRTDTVSSLPDRAAAAAVLAGATDELEAALVRIGPARQSPEHNG